MGPGPGSSRPGHICMPPPCYINWDLSNIALGITETVFKTRA